MTIVSLIRNVLIYLLAVTRFVEPFDLAKEKPWNPRPAQDHRWGRPFYRPGFDRRLPLQCTSSEESSNERIPPRQIRTTTPEAPKLGNALPPYIAIVTEPDACDSEERWNATLHALQAAISTHRVHLVSVRLSPTHSNAEVQEEQHFKSRYVRMIQQLRSWSSLDARNDPSFYVVISSGPYMELGVSSGAHGVHFKEAHGSQIPKVREWYRRQFSVGDDSLLVGTSVHSIPSAVKAYRMYQPDYLFVGTCYATASHPDKLVLEGPALPGQVCNALILAVSNEKESPVPPPPSPHHCRPVVLAIGGINASNCAALWRSGRGADGVAVIRAVLQAPDPAEAVHQIYQEMKQKMKAAELN